MKTTYAKVITELIQALENEEFLIDEDRQNELRIIAEQIIKDLRAKNSLKVIVICTHNSRRSQLGELWIRVAADYHGIKNVESFSGGTEATNFNIRMIKALTRVGFVIDMANSSTNPNYLINWMIRPKENPLMYSKKYTHSANPQNNFMAIIVCDQADQNCPNVLGASTRYFLPYQDPKKYDDTFEEELQYDLKVREIGREILFMFKEVKTNLNDK